MKPHLELIPLEPLTPTQPQNTSYQDALALVRNSIIQQNLEDFLQKHRIEQKDYVDLVAFALHHNIEEFIVSLSAHTLRDQKGVCKPLLKAFSRELIHLIGIEFAHFFNKNAQMKKAQKAFFKQIKLSDKNLCLRIINGELITSEDLQCHPHPDQRELYTVFAAANNHLDSLKNLRLILNENPDNLQESLMAAAIVNGSSQILSYLLDLGFELTTEFKINAKCKKKSTCLLSLAAEANQFETFKLLHTRGAQFTPMVLQQICAIGRDDFIKYCLQCDSTLFETPAACNYVIAAAMAGHKSTLQLLCEHTALFKIDGMVSKTLNAAMQNEVIQGLNKNYQFNDQGVTIEEHNAFLYMVKLTHRQLIEHLFRMGVRAEDHERKLWGEIMVILLRLRYQDPINHCINLFPIALNQDLWTLVLFEACRIGDITTMDFLHHQGLSLEVFAADGNNPLFTAIEYNQLSLLQRLLQLNVNLTATNPLQETCLMIAVRACSDSKLFELLINALKQKLSRDELTTFTNLISVRGNTALNTGALKLKVNRDFESRLQLAESLLALGAQLFEEIPQAGTNEVHLITHYSDLKDQQESPVLYWLAAKKLLEFPVVPHYYYAKFDEIRKVMTGCENSDSTYQIFSSFSKRAKHIKILSIFQGALVDPLNDDSVLNRLICEAIAIFASWTEYALPTFVNDCMQPEFNQQRLNRLVKSILSLGASKSKSVICIEVADKLCAACNVEESLTAAQLKHCRLLIIALYEASAVDDDHVKTQIISQYQLLTDIQDYFIYDNFSNLFDAVGESQQKALLQVKEEKAALLQQLSCSRLDMALSSKKLFMQAILQCNRQLILDGLKAKTCTLLEPLDDMGRNAIQLAQPSVLVLLLEHAIRHYEQIKFPTASEIEELASLCPLIPNGFSKVNQLHTSLLNLLAIFRAYNEVKTLANRNPGSLVTACQFHKPTVLDFLNTLYSKIEPTRAQVTARNNGMIQIFSMQSWDAQLLECVINGRVNPPEKAFACLLLCSIPGHEYKKNDFINALLDIWLIPTPLNPGQIRPSLTDFTRNEPRRLLLGILNVLKYFIKISNRDFYYASLVPLLEKASKPTVLSEFMTECYCIKQCILENLGDFRNRFHLTSKIVIQIEQGCLWQLGQKLAVQLNESEQIQKTQQARIEFLEQTLTEQKEQFNDEKKRTRPWSPRLIGQSEDELKRPKQELDEEHLSEEDLHVKK